MKRIFVFMLCCLLCVGCLLGCGGVEETLVPNEPVIEEQKKDETPSPEDETPSPENETPSPEDETPSPEDETPSPEDEIDTTPYGIYYSRASKKSLYIEITVDKVRDFNSTSLYTDYLYSFEENVLILHTRLYRDGSTEVLEFPHKYLYFEENQVLAHKDYVYDKSLDVRDGFFEATLKFSIETLYFYRSGSAQIMGVYGSSSTMHYTLVSGVLILVPSKNGEYVYENSSEHYRYFSLSGVGYARAYVKNIKSYQKPEWL